MKVLIIGGSRFLGLAISEAFINKGHDVYVMNRGSSASAKNVKEQITCDKTDRKTFTEVLRKWRWDIIIDTILNDEDIRFLVKTAGTNLGHFIHTSSLGVYGEARRIPAIESMPLYEYTGNEHVVFNSKLRQEQVILRAFQEQGFPGTILRMSYIYGQGDIPLDGWGGRSGEFFRMLRNGEKVLLPNDGRALLHPGHVKDLGRAFLNTAERSNSIGQIYNICGHYALMMKDYITMIAGIMGVETDLEFSSVGDICKRFPGITSERAMKFACQHMCASITKAEQELDWMPEVSLNEGMRENIQWMKEQKII